MRERLEAEAVAVTVEEGRAPLVRIDRTEAPEVDASKTGFQQDMESRFVFITIAVIPNYDSIRSERFDCRPCAVVSVPSINDDHLVAPTRSCGASAVGPVDVTRHQCDLCVVRQLGLNATKPAFVVLA